MENGKIILEKTTDNTTVAVNATGETMFYLLAAFITGVCEKNKFSLDDFLTELTINCIALNKAKEMSENEA